MASFGTILKQLRTEIGISQNELSKFVGISKSSINMYERGEREPSFETLEAIADFFNVDMDYLLGREPTSDSNRNSLAYSISAMQLARDYDKLDEYGKKTLQDTLKREQDRMERELALKESLQTLVNTFTTLRIYKTPITDTTGIDLTEEPETKMVSTNSKTPDNQRNTVKQVMLVKNPFGVRFRFDDGKEIIFAIDGDAVAEPGQAGIFTIDGKSFLKRLENDGLYPVQPEQEPIPVPDILQRTGRVIGWFGSDLISDTNFTPIYF